MFKQVCIIEPSFFNATSRMHRHPIEGQHLVFDLTLISQSIHSSLNFKMAKLIIFIANLLGVKAPTF